MPENEGAISCPAQDRRHVMLKHALLPVVIVLLAAQARQLKTLARLFMKPFFLSLLGHLRAYFLNVLAFLLVTLAILLANLPK